MSQLVYDYHKHKTYQRHQKIAYPFEYVKSGHRQSQYHFHLTLLDEERTPVPPRRRYKFAARLQFSLCGRTVAKRILYHYHRGNPLFFRAIFRYRKARKSLLVCIFKGKIFADKVKRIKSMISSMRI